MSEIQVSITYNKNAEKELLHSSAWRATLNRLGFTITGHAVPLSGVDTGALVQSMGHSLVNTDEAYELVLGSGAASGVEEVWYAAPHWAKRSPLKRPDRTRSRKSRPHPTKPAPTKPWSKALRALGIAYKVEPGGFEA